MYSFMKPPIAILNFQHRALIRKNTVNYVPVGKMRIHMWLMAPLLHDFTRLDQHRDFARLKAEWNPYGPTTQSTTSSHPRVFSCFYAMKSATGQKTISEIVSWYSTPKYSTFKHPHHDINHYDDREDMHEAMQLKQLGWRLHEDGTQKCTYSTTMPRYAITNSSNSSQQDNTPRKASPDSKFHLVTCLQILNTSTHFIRTTNSAFLYFWGCFRLVKQ